MFSLTKMEIPRSGQVLVFLVIFTSSSQSWLGDTRQVDLVRPYYVQRYWDQKPAASGYYPAAVAVGFNSGGGGGGEIGFYGGGGDRGKHIDYRQGGFNKGYEDVRHGGQDTGYLDQTQSRAKGHTDQAGYNQQRQQAGQGQAQQGYGRKGGQRKGHHSTGFRNSYHKDETGEKESFWDDADDRGAQWSSKDQAAGYRGGVGQNQRSGYLDQTLDARDGSRLSKQGGSVDYSQSRGGQGGFRRQGHNDDGLGYGRRYKIYDQHQHQHRRPIYKRVPVLGSYSQPDLSQDYGTYPLDGQDQDLLDDYSSYGDDTILDGQGAHIDDGPSGGYIQQGSRIDDGPSGGYLQKGGLFDDNLPPPVAIGTATYIDGPPPKPVSVQYKKYVY